MQRRRFVISASGAVITAIAPKSRVNLLGFIGVATAHAQGRGRVPAIGYLSRGFPGGRGHDAFRQGLREIGYDENGETLVVTTASRKATTHGSPTSRRSLCG